MHHHFDSVDPIDGITVENTQVEANETVTVRLLTRAQLTSDSPEFHIYTESFCGLFLYPKNIFIDSVSQFLVVIHVDQTADLYVNDFPVTIEVTPKKDMNLGEILMLSDIADTRKVSFPSVSISETDKIIYCFKVGWRFGLFFDIATRTDISNNENSGEGEKLDIEGMKTSIGDIHRYLTYYSVFQIMASEPLFQELVKDGWFPFIEILSGEYKVLGEIYKNKLGFENRISETLNGFTEARVRKIIARWWTKPVFSEKKVIIEAGINAYLQNTPDGCINSIKNLLTEIEGVLRRIFHIETGIGNGIKSHKLVSHIIEKARRKTGSNITLFLPESFLEYLQNVVFANFDVEKGDFDLSRNSASHGVASDEQYTRSRALQAILILDQIYYYI